MNIAIIMGRLGRDPETKTMSNGNTLVTFSVATDEVYEQGGAVKKSTTWHSVISWDQKRNPYLASELRKGSWVHVLGSISINQWEDKNGNKRSTPQIKAKEVTILSATGDKRTPAMQAYLAGPSEPQPSDANDDDIPF